MKTNFVFCTLILCFFIACNSSAGKDAATSDSKKEIVETSKKESAALNTEVADAATILAKRQVPVLCYHHIREPKPGQSETMKSYSVSPSQFAQQMKALKDSGYETILPNQLYDYLVHGGTLPAKPVMLTFDDTDEEQFSIGYQEMKKYG